jgi:hypothetical protein
VEVLGDSPDGELYAPLPPIWYFATPAGEPRKKPLREDWGWARCESCGAVCGKPITSRGGVTRVKATHRRCPFCGAG